MLINIIGKMKNAVDKGTILGALMTNPSKAVDCLNHERLIVKLRAYGFTLSALKLIHNYL